jgi:aflatoxin B1 aldehyde reductase
MADKHNLTMAEIALRWISHHGLMKREYGDSVLIGASSVEHIKQVNGLRFSYWQFD